MIPPPPSSVREIPPPPPSVKLIPPPPPGVVEVKSKASLATAGKSAMMGAAKATPKYEPTAIQRATNWATSGMPVPISAATKKTATRIWDDVKWADPARKISETLTALGTPTKPESTNLIDLPRTARSISREAGGIAGLVSPTMAADFAYGIGDNPKGTFKQIAETYNRDMLKQGSNFMQAPIANTLPVLGLLGSGVGAAKSIGKIRRLPKAVATPELPVEAPVIEAAVVDPTVALKEQKAKLQQRHDAIQADIKHVESPNAVSPETKAAISKLNNGADLLNSRIKNLNKKTDLHNQQYENAANSGNQGEAMASQERAVATNAEAVRLDGLRKAKLAEAEQLKQAEYAKIYQRTAAQHGPQANSLSGLKMELEKTKGNLGEIEGQIFQHQQTVAEAASAAERKAFVESQNVPAAPTTPEAVKLINLKPWLESRPWYQRTKKWYQGYVDPTVGLDAANRPLLERLYKSEDIAANRADGALQKMAEPIAGMRVNWNGRPVDADVVLDVYARAKQIKNEYVPRGENPGGFHGEDWQVSAEAWADKQLQNFNALSDKEKAAITTAQQIAVEQNRIPIQRLVDEGIMTPEAAQKWFNDRPDHIPGFREFEAVDSPHHAGRETGVGIAEGSSKKRMQNVFDATYTQNVNMNRFADDMIVRRDVAEKAFSDIDAVPVPAGKGENIYMEPKNLGKSEIWYVNKGERFKKDIGDELLAMELMRGGQKFRELQSNIYYRLAMASKDVATTGVTVAWKYLSMAPIRDMYSRILNDPNITGTPMKALTRVVPTMLKAPIDAMNTSVLMVLDSLNYGPAREIMNMFRENGLPSRTFANEGAAVEGVGYKAYTTTGARKLGHIAKQRLRHPVSTLKLPANFLERLPRVMKMIADGEAQGGFAWTPKRWDVVKEYFEKNPGALAESGQQASRVTAQFSKRGTKMAYGTGGFAIAARTTPFLSGGLSGVREMINTTKRSPTGAAIGIAQVSVIPTLAVWLINKKTKNPNYEYTDAETRNRYYIIGKWHIPKPYDFSMAGNMLERLLDAHVGDNEELVSGMWNAFTSSLMPLSNTVKFGDINVGVPIFGPQPLMTGVGLMTGRDTFSQNTINPKTYKPKYGGATVKPSTSKLITDAANVRIGHSASGKKGFSDYTKITPPMIQYGLENPTGHLGRLAVQGADVAYTGKGGKEFIRNLTGLSRIAPKPILDTIGNRLVSDYFSRSYEGEMASDKGVEKTPERTARKLLHNRTYAPIKVWMQDRMSDLIKAKLKGDEAEQIRIARRINARLIIVDNLYKKLKGNN